MRRSFVAVAALAFASAASAQSSVTLYGVVDVMVSGYKTKSETPLGVTVTKSLTQLANSGGGFGSRLGFRGTEDLGGGLGAGFWLEAGFAPDTGNGTGAGGGLIFNRRSTVSFLSPWGEVRLGRDYTPTFWNDTTFDPFTVAGVGTNLITNASGGATFGVPNSGFQLNPNYVRTSNSIGYFLPPNLGGFYGQFMYGFNEKTSYDPGGLTPPGSASVAANPATATADNARVGRLVGGRIGYSQGPLNIAFAYAESTVGSNYYLGSTTTLNTWNLGGSYDFDVVKLFGEYSNNKLKTSRATNTFNPLGNTRPGANGGLVGVAIPIGAGLIRASYSFVKYNNMSSNLLGLNPDPEARQFAVGYVYNLSKRTALYTTVAYIKNKNGAALAVTGSPTFFTGTFPGGGGAAVPNRSMGYDFGLRHFF